MVAVLSTLALVMNCSFVKNFCYVWSGFYKWWRASFCAYVVSGI